MEGDYSCRVPGGLHIPREPALLYLANCLIADRVGRLSVMQPLQS
jgi:hypothetical protein